MRNPNTNSHKNTATNNENYVDVLASDLKIILSFIDYKEATLEEVFLGQINSFIRSNGNAECDTISFEDIRKLATSLADVAQFKDSFDRVAKAIK